MRYRINELPLPLDYQDHDISKAVSKKLGIKEEDVQELVIIRRSIDARRKLTFVFTVEFSLDESIPFKKTKEVIVKESDKKEPVLVGLNIQMKQRPIVVGAGPAGLLAALVMARNGLKPILFERGADVTTRSIQVADYWKKGIFNKESNTLYGEGGAGLFSDGKLTARSKDKPGIKYLLETFVQCGAPDSILIDAEPHLGSDLLKEIVPRLRKKIIDAGGDVYFDSCVESLLTENGELRGVIVDGKEFPSNICVLATGHSARDVYKALADSGVQLDQKAFAVGVRLEVPQEVINQSQWGKFAKHPRLGAASFRFTSKETDKTRACYTFCMCPGGLVIPCASSEGLMTTNGMSLSARSLEHGNAAFLVPVRPDDYQVFGTEAYPELAGCEFQADIEKKAFIEGGSNYGIPVSNLARFIDPTLKSGVSEKRSFSNVKEAEIRNVLPEFVTDTLVTAIPKMIRSFQGVDYKDVTLYAAETRSSSPVRIKRDETRQSVNTKGLYPCGEGAGYAGGIVSSALDGIRVAESIVRNHIK